MATYVEYDPVLGGYQEERAIWVVNGSLYEAVRQWHGRWEESHWVARKSITIGGDNPDSYGPFPSFEALKAGMAIIESAST